MIRLRDITKRFGDIVAVDDVNLSVPAGRIHGVLGRSGAGKSTLLRTVNLLERPDRGTVEVDGVDLTRLDHDALRHARSRIGMVFQHFRLLHNRTVAANVALPLKLHGTPRNLRATRVRELLELVGLPDKADAYPSRLSGGQRQRVAIARALASGPEVLLSDEATSALDPQTTIDILDLLVKLRAELGLTILLITHELDVVTRICDSASIMTDGAVTESGPVADLLATPGSQLGSQAFRLPDEGVSLDPRTGLEITFTGAAVGDPVVATLVNRFGLDVSITDAAVHTTTSGTVGRLRLRLPEGTDPVPAVEWLATNGYGVRRA
ncbi:D-methionine transport system ATP-binding protein [Stackebrandtia albiflava]|uniref:D-methionine transport system ATP-binding protein n=1 Tax=Stackebrandtia albiflava TaxID=406432 RepID=A0A562V4U0_9ACTN|nr:ATP-binding cassette domain-containing protein [Stackebrandtia albiflava]TWJ12904.1 D-methionine transport system ATP-binding protein [Stackebrandtia albiflava]